MHARRVGARYLFDIPKRKRQQQPGTPSGIANTMRLVLDTNVWLDWLIFADAAVVPIQTAVKQSAASIFISPACSAELHRVLGYTLSGRTLTAPEQVAALTLYQAITHVVDNSCKPHTIAALPQCADPNDQMFLELARDCRADALITKDRDLLVLARLKVRPLPFRIIAPQAFSLDASRTCPRMSHAEAE